ncbi:hypothetical protein VNO78_13578 [Psophocarpus tetragonolobus]|uniref:Uncharacterized protein n=1 Tax=Psophocarpus tetragonolobus TaxID=3891 RepID=A0AAN9SSB0_PSOTE
MSEGNKGCWTSFIALDGERETTPCAHRLCSRRSAYCNAPHTWVVANEETTDLVKTFGAVNERAWWRGPPSTLIIAKEARPGPRCFPLNVTRGPDTNNYRRGGVSPTNAVSLSLSGFNGTVTALECDVCYGDICRHAQAPRRVRWIRIRERMCLNPSD